MQKKTLMTALILVALLIATAGCGDKATTTTHDEPATTTSTETTAKAADTNPNIWTGKVLETMDAGGYTYVLVDTGSEQIWAAAPITAVSVGQEINVPKGMMMTNFPSKILDRTFDEIYFVEGIYAAGSMPAAGGAASGMGGMGGMPKDPNHAGVGGGNANTQADDAEVENVVKAAGGYTVEELFAQTATLGGQNVKVRGRVVKFSANIMGTNWIHIQDASQGDLTITTAATVAIGDLVMVEGTLTVDKDFGAGYRYDAIIEKATVTKE